MARAAPVVAIMTMSKNIDDFPRRKPTARAGGGEEPEPLAA
jgi:hypothetical protein